jgi:hypothetical protein
LDNFCINFLDCNPINSNISQFLCEFLCWIESYEIVRFGHSVICLLTHKGGKQNLKTTWNFLFHVKCSKSSAYEQKNYNKKAFQIIIIIINMFNRILFEKVSFLTFETFICIFLLFTMWWKNKEMWNNRRRNLLLKINKIYSCVTKWKILSHCCGALNFQGSTILCAIQLIVRLCY